MPHCLRVYRGRTSRTARARPADVLGGAYDVHRLGARGEERRPAGSRLSPYRWLMVVRLIGIGTSMPSTCASTRCSYRRQRVKRDR